jgi:hypothetical protein
MKSHDALRAARLAHAELEQRIRRLDEEHVAASAELTEADAELTRQLGADQIGESNPAALAAAHQRHEAASRALRSLGAGRELLVERLPVTEAAVESAAKVFAEEAAEGLAPERERLRTRLKTLVPEVQAAFRDFARVDALTSRIPIGTRTGANLLRAAGLDDDALALLTGSEHRRLTETEVLERLRRVAQAAE